MINVQQFFYLFFFIILYQNALANEKGLIVEADNSIEYFEKERYYLATGNAIASKNGITLKADKNGLVSISPAVGFLSAK